MRRSSSAFVRRTHSSSISRQAQMLPITSTTAMPPPPPSPEMRTPSTPTRIGSPGTERVKEWADIFDGPMRSPAFVPPPSSSPPPPASPTRDTDNGANSIIFDGPARPRYIIPGAYIRTSTTSTQNQQRNGSETGSPSTTPRKDSSRVSDVSALLSRSSLPPPRIYDGPAFEWELQTKRV